MTINKFDVEFDVDVQFRKAIFQHFCWDFEKHLRRRPLAVRQETLIKP
jgi:hypothetical protein